MRARARDARRADMGPSISEGVRGSGGHGERRGVLPLGPAHAGRQNGAPGFCRRPAGPRTPHRAFGPSASFCRLTPIGQVRGPDRQHAPTLAALARRTRVAGALSICPQASHRQFSRGQVETSRTGPAKRRAMLRAAARPGATSNERRAYMGGERSAAALSRAATKSAMSDPGIGSPGGIRRCSVSGFT